MSVMHQKDRAREVEANRKAGGSGAKGHPDFAPWATKIVTSSQPQQVKKGHLSQCCALTFKDNLKTWLQ